MLHTLADPPDSEQGPQPIPCRPRPPIVQPLTDSKQQFRIGLVEAIMSQPVPEAHLNAALDARIEGLIELVLNSRYTVAELRPILRADLLALISEAVAYNEAVVLDTTVRR